MGLASELFHIGAAILSDTVDSVTNALTAQLGSITEEYVFSDSAEIYQDIGLVSRVSNPTKGAKAAECLAIKGDRDVVFARRDLRGTSIYGNLGPGETCLYAGGLDGNSQGRVIIKNDGSVTLMTTENNLPADQGGQPVALRISPTKGFEFTSQFGSITLDKTGFHVKTAAGPRIDMGGLVIPGLSALPGIGTLTEKMGSYATITAPFVNIQGATTTIGMGPVFNCAGSVVPGPASPTQIVPGVPAGIQSIATLTCSGTVYVST
jgi:hypothetical protein